MFTGGDDCGVGVTRVADGEVETKVVPRAHAAAVVAVVDMGVLVTVGGDQRVRVWKVEGVEGVKGVAEGEGGVADVAGAVGVRREGEDREGRWVLVAGVGVDLWRVN